MTITSGLINHQIRLAARPVGLPKDSDWSHTEEAVSAPSSGGFLIKTFLLSLDPAMRGWMNEGKSYIAPVGLGEVMRAGGVGKVIASEDPRFPVGCFVNAALGVQEYCRVDPENLRQLAPHIVDLGLAPAEKWLNPLGMPGMTAYFGLLDVGQPKPGETVVVSGAAGAVGQTVGQIAKIKGARAVGIAGGKAKCEFVVNELGFDACIDYKQQPLKEGLKEHCPKGVDVYFDNVGGDTLDAVLARLTRGARVVICGAISQYNNTTPIKGPANYLSLLVNRARMEGIVVFDYAARFPQAVGEIGHWMKEGKLRSREDIVDGLGSFPQTLLKLFNGENFGKLVLRVAAS
ncbi:MAG: NADP-dependent oxidoreductase [Burkholderiaceae bacterium]|jgi:NADPH-dependent curcumin reductase CurA